MNDSPSRSTSYLLRFWQEPTERPGKPVLRCYLRNLRTGEETYLNDARKLGEQVLRQVPSAPATGQPRRQAISLKGKRR